MKLAATALPKITLEEPSSSEVKKAVTIL